MSSFFASLVLALAVFAPVSARAYVRTTIPGGAALHWSSRCATFAPAISADAEIGDTVARAIASWNLDACSAMPFAVDEDTRPTTVGHDQINAILWRTDGCDEEDPTPLCDVPNAAAVTTILYDDAGEIVEVDIELDARAFLATGIDLDGVVTHELGHALGLDHACSVIPGLAPDDHLGVPSPACSDPRAREAEIRWATMYPVSAPGETFKRDPLDEERAGLCSIYGAHDGACTRSRGCASSSPGVAAVPFLVLAAILRRRRRASVACTRRPSR